MFANGLQPWHIIVLVIVLIALFGAKRLPAAARGIGQSMRIFKSEAKQLRDEHHADADADDSGPEGAGGTATGPDARHMEAAPSATPASAPTHGSNGHARTQP